jgi:hypothetical protein
VVKGRELVPTMLIPKERKKEKPKKFLGVARETNFER